MAVSVLLLSLLVPLGLGRLSAAREVPPQAQVIDQRAWMGLDTVLPPSQADDNTVSLAELRPLLLLLLLDIKPLTMTRRSLSGPA